MKASINGAKYVVFDGMDGSGKGTQMKLLQEKFGDSVVFTREPGGTPLAENLREIILREPCTPLTEMLLFLASRSELRSQVIVPALQRGLHVFSDRSDSSTWAFQLNGREHKVEFLDLFILTRKMILPRPDLYIIFDLPAEVARKRALGDTGRVADHIDKLDLMFYERVRNGFREFQKWAPVEFIDATQMPEEIQQNVVAVLASMGIEPG